MDEPISARYEWNADQMTEALHIHQTQLRTTSDRLLLGSLQFLLLMISVGVPSAFVIMPGPWSKKLIIVAVFACVFGPIWGVLHLTFRSKVFQRRAARRAFRHTPAAMLVEWSFSELELSSRTPFSASTMLWPLFIKVVESPRGFMLYYNINYFSWVPAQGFASADAIRRFAELARSRVAHYVVLGECQFPAKPEPVGLDEF